MHYILLFGGNNLFKAYDIPIFISNSGPEQYNLLTSETWINHTF